MTIHARPTETCWESANTWSGEYVNAASNFELNLARNGPTGPHMDVFVAAAYGRLDKGFRARAILERLAESHPDYPVEEWLANYIKNPEELQSAMTMLRELGLPDD